jgi:iron complex transport system substrate-binding protein
MCSVPRIISLAPDATSILFALGAQKNLVAVSKWCKDVVPTGNLPKVGDCWALNIDAVRKLRPDLLIGSVPFKPEVVAQLIELPSNFLALNPRSLAHIERNIVTLGKLTNRTAAATKLVSKMRRAFANLKHPVGKHGTDGPRAIVYSEAWPNPRISSPPWVAELVELTGAKFAVPPGQCVTDEQVAAAAPDLIILAWTGTHDRSDPRSAYKYQPWQNIPAVRNRRVVVIREELLNTPGPPLIEGARELARAIHSLDTQSLDTQSIDVHFK